MNDLTTRVARLLWSKLPRPQTCPDEIDAAARAVVALVMGDAQVNPLGYDAETLLMLLDDPDPSEITWLENNAKSAAVIRRLLAERDALRAKLDVAKREMLSASLFAAELAESIGPSDEWSHDFKEGYIFGGRDAARTIRQKCTFPDADIARKPHPQ